MLRFAKLGLAMALICLAADASAQRIFGWCEQGGHRVVTNGLESSTKVQTSYPACTVTVFNGGTVVPATIFSDAGLTTPLANPFTATSAGFWAFFGAPSTYDVQFSGTGITTPFTIAGYTNSGGGGGGGGSVGPGTVNNLSKFTSTTNVGNATCTDDGVTPMSCGLGMSLSTSALFTVKPNNASTGTTVNLLIARDSSGKAINAQPTDTSNVIGVAGFGAGTTGSVSIAYSGQFPCIFDNQTAIGDWVTLGSSSRCHDAGATEPAGIENMGRINSINAGTGTLAGVDWGLPDSTNTSAGGGTGVVNPCANASALAYYATTGNTVSCPAGATVDGSGNISAPSFTGSGANAGFIVSQQGTVPTLGVANSNYLYADSTVTTTFGTALPSTPGTLNQLLAVTSVPDATHIKLGYVSGSCPEGTCILNTPSGDQTITAFKLTLPNLIDNGLGISLPVCTDGSKQLTTAGCVNGSPGGSNTEVQFNDSGSFGGDLGFTYNKTTDIASVGSAADTALSGLITISSPAIDPMAWGAVGDGVADDTVPWQAAVNFMEAHGGWIHCVAGRKYKLDRVLLNSFDTIVGDYADSPGTGCVINVKTDAAFVSRTPTNYLGSVTIAGINISGGSNQIDLPLINQAVFEHLQLQNYTGCGIAIIDGEHRHITDINSYHNAVDGFAALCTGDKSKSLFGGSIPNPGFEYGFASGVVNHLFEVGTLNASPGSQFSAQWLWYGSGIVAGGGGGPTAGGTADTTVNDIICRFSCITGVLQFYDVLNTTFDVIGMDNDGLVATPMAIGFNIQNLFRRSRVNSYTPSYNTNHITTEMFVGGMEASSIENSLFSPSADNVTTFGLKFAGAAGTTGTLFNVKGAVYGGGASASTTKAGVTIIGSQLGPNNMASGAQLADSLNQGIQMTLVHDGTNSTASTACFNVLRFGGGGLPGSQQSDFTSCGGTSGFSIFEPHLIKSSTVLTGVNSNSAVTPVAAVEFQTGVGTAGALAGGQTTADIAFNYGAAAGGFRNWMRSQHVNATTGSFLGFYINNTSGGGAASSAPGTGNNLSLQVDATGTTSPNPKVSDMLFGSNQSASASACEATFGITTLNTGAATTDTTNNCLPANSIIDAVVYRVTTAITTSASFTIGDATTAARFCGTQSTLTLGATGRCFVQADQTGAAGPIQAAAAKVRMTLNANPGAGAIRLIVYYHTWTPPTS